APAGFRTAPEASGVRVEKATVTGFGYGIQIVDRAEASLADVTVAGNERHGLLVRDGATVPVDGLDARENGGNGVRLDGAAGLSRLTAVTATDNLGTAGIAIVNARAVLADSRAADNAGHGLMATKGAKVVATASSFCGNTRYGVRVEASGLDISDSELSDNGQRGLQLSAEAQGTIWDNQVKNNGVDGLSVCDLAPGVVCHGQGIAMADRSTAVITANRITGNGNNGIFIGSGGVAELTGNTVDQNMYHGVEAQGQGTVVTFHDHNTVTRSGPDPALTVAARIGASGIGAYLGAAVKIVGAGNQADGNDANGVTASGTSTVTITAPFEASSNGKSGLAAYERAAIRATAPVTADGNARSGLYAASKRPDAARISYCGLTGAGNAPNDSLATGTGVIRLLKKCG
ncbi:MAG: right-handed parallel beta-helix repeat-containing protein, partial [Propionibacteriaceae bacterium]|nr:right-handed parallel beta-helix repeat-containing protein [Propionibacteriaceae bacterium]